MTTHEKSCLVPLGNGLDAVIDNSMAETINAHRWFANKKGQTAYAQRFIKKPEGKATLVQMHRVLMNAQPGQFVDHIDGDGLNNRIENLRFATLSQNQGNQRRRLDNKSGYKGVRRVSRNSGDVWRAYISVDGKRHSLGYFLTVKEAAAAYATASGLMFGEYAKKEIVTPRWLDAPDVAGLWLVANRNNVCGWQWFTLDAILYCDGLDRSDYRYYGPIPEDKNES